jgi:hypothetical protein
MHSPEQARQEMVVVVPQTVIVQRWVPRWLGQSSHLWKNWHESDFAGRATAAVRRNAQASSKTLALFMSVISLGWEPRHEAPTQDGAADAVRRDRSSLYPGGKMQRVLHEPQDTDTTIPLQMTSLQSCFSGTGVAMQSAQK